MTPPETRLAVLIGSMEPELVEGEWAFVTLPDGADPAPLRPRAVFVESEGVSAVVRCKAARRHGLAHDGAFRQITLRVRSSLHAVGLTAAVAARLAERGIPANVVAATHHDHVFVPAERADEALRSLVALSAGR